MTYDALVRLLLGKSVPQHQRLNCLYLIGHVTATLTLLNVSNAELFAGSSVVLS